MVNVLIPKYVPDNLKWHEKDRLETWYRKNKCEEFIIQTYTLKAEKLLISIL